MLTSKDSELGCAVRQGESPWAVHEAADCVPRLEWSWYEPDAGWKIELGRAVAASACVPGIFAPLSIKSGYEGIDVQLVDRWRA